MDLSPKDYYFVPFFGFYFRFQKKKHAFFEQEGQPKI